MNYYITAKKEDFGQSHDAKSKPKADIDDICKEIGLIAVPVNCCRAQRSNRGALKKIAEHYKVYTSIKEATAHLKEGDMLFSQFPAPWHTIFFARQLKRLKRRGIKFVMLIHDLASREKSKTKVPIKMAIRSHLEEKGVLSQADKIIVHNKQMIKWFERMEIAENKLIALNIFDYLIDNYDKNKLKQRKRNKPVIIAGNLDKVKAEYVYKLPDNCQFNVYGPSYDEALQANRQTVYYKGSFAPKVLTYELDGSFGLVWDGSSTETCTGILGEYLRVNNPHKTSLYLAIGIPVIVWKEAAIADFVMENKCGVTVNSLFEIADIINNMTDAEYAELKENAEKIGVSLRRGEYLKSALAKC